MAPRYVRFGVVLSLTLPLHIRAHAVSRGDDDELEDLAGEGDDQALRELAWRRAQADSRLI